MSLLFRKDCQDVLNIYGLTQYHAEINCNKSISVVSECGKPLFGINGIKFSKSAPSVKECEYALELFSKFMRKHEDTINDYIAAYVDMEENKLPDDAYNTENERGVYLYSHSTYGPAYIKLPFATIQMTFEKKINSITLAKPPVDTLDELANFSQSEQYKEACDLIDKLNKFKSLELVFQKISSKLNSCDI